MATNIPSVQGARGNKESEAVMKGDNLRDKIIGYMLQHRCGFRNARPREEISRALEIEDRTFRKICTSIPEIVSNSRIKQIKIDFFTTVTVGPGYYIIPLIDYDGLETKVAKILLREQGSRAAKEWDRVHSTEKLLDERFGKQGVFA